jgi:hypothetical protein
MISMIPEMQAVIKTGAHPRNAKQKNSRTGFGVSSGGLAHKPNLSFIRSFLEATRLDNGSSIKPHLYNPAPWLTGA